MKIKLYDMAALQGFGFNAFGVGDFSAQSSFSGEYLYSTVFVKAAALAHSLILNHPFIDGNKRTGVVSALVFLEINGYSLNVIQDQLVEKAFKIATKACDIERLPIGLRGILGRRSNFLINKSV